MGNVLKVVIIIPTYNEARNIAPLVEALHEQFASIQHDMNILVVDDNSPDGTADLVRKMQRKHPGRIHLNERKGKLGLGTAYIHGFKWALKQDYQYIFEMDADFSHDPKDLPRLLEACEVYGADLAIGSRYSKGVNVVNWPMSRVLLSYFASKYVRLVTGMPIHDTTAGFKCYRRAVLEAIDFEKIRFVGYAFQIEMKYRTFAKGFVIKEIPVIFTDRTKGQSKMSGAIIKEAVFGVLALRIKKFFNQL